MEIDAAIQIPDVDTVPIVQVGYYNAEPAEGWKEELEWGKRTVVTDIEGWEEVEYREDALILYNGWKDAPKSVDGRRVNKNQEAKGVWYNGFDAEKAYIPMCDLTFGAFCSMIRGELSRFGFDPDQYEIENPSRMHTQHWYYYGYKEDALPGSLHYYTTQKFCGIPYLSGILSAVSDHVNGETRRDEIGLYNCEMVAGYDGYANWLSHLFVDYIQVQNTLAADVPLCSIDKVIKAVEPMIEQGHIRKIYEIKLGYVGFNEPGVYREKDERVPYAQQRFYLKPMWQVNCLYTNSGNAKLSETASYTDDERNTLNYYQLLVDAQTGDLVQESTAYDRCEYKGFISWEEVGQNP